MYISYELWIIWMIWRSTSEGVLLPRDFLFLMHDLSLQKKFISSYFFAVLSSKFLFNLVFFGDWELFIDYMHILSFSPHRMGRSRLGRRLGRSRMGRTRLGGSRLGKMRVGTRPSLPLKPTTWAISFIFLFHVVSVILSSTSFLSHELSMTTNIGIF